ncbi:MAG: adenylate/guanylate cyclase domain-containing protein [Myxococcales bacterium]|nr:adenylate/guanylate cyclase domain-containing protein [Myxococcales bacterium]
MANSTLPQPAAPSGDLVEQIIAHRMQQNEIKTLLQAWQPHNQEAFVGKMADTLRKVSTLLDVSRQVSDASSLDALLPRMVEMFSELLHSDRSTIFLFDAETNELYSRLSQGTLEQEQWEIFGAPVGTGIRFPSNKGIAGHVFTTGETVLIEDAYEDPRFYKDVDEKTGYQTKTIICAPIQDTNGRIIGVVQSLNKHGGPFTESDLTLLGTLAKHTSSVFVNARLSEEIRRIRDEEAQLLEVTTAISRELKLLPLLQRIMETVTNILNADRSTLFMHDDKSKTLWSHVAQGLESAEIRIPDHVGIAGSVFTSGKTINIPDAYEDERFNKAMDQKTGYKTDTILCMPILDKKGQPIGVIQVLNKRGGPFTDMDETRLRAFSSQAYTAIENARLFEDLVQVKNYNESILESMTNGLLTINANNRIVKVNHGALSLFQSQDKPGEVLGKDYTQFFSGQNAWVAEMIGQVQKSGLRQEAMNVDLWLPHADPAKAAAGEKESASVNMSSVSLKNASGENIGCLLVLEDITTEKRLRGTMARYMNKDIADKLLEEGEDALGGKTQKATVFFTDIRDFTSLSERIGPTETVTMLNNYFSIMVDILSAKGGILDKYIGDAMMAVFGAPFPGPKDADNAMQTGIEMLKALRTFNAAWTATGNEPLRMGIGVNTDEILSGNIGSPKRMDYTVIGDGANLAARLEGANKYYGTEMLVSGLTLKELKEEYTVRKVDLIQVKGKQQPVAMYEVMDHYDDASFPNLQASLKVFSSGFQSYQNKTWDEARAAFSEALRLNPKDELAAMYLERCRHFQESPPPPDWDGVWVMADK